MRAAIFVLVAACGTNLTPHPEPPPELPSCVPDRDGQITPDELPIAFGSTVAYYASPAGATRTINTGAMNRHWDLSDETNDPVIALGPTELKNQWYAASFPAGELVVDGGGGLDGIYHQDDTALWLDGTASREMAPAAGKTLVRYAQPIAVLRFPVADGDRYSTLAQIPDGIVAGLPFIGTDQVDVDVTGDGSLDVPYVRFSPALRVRTLVTRKPSTGTPVVTRRNTIFLFECFGEVARAESRVDEPAADFTTAAYLRRFALGVTP
ncbi:MAG: hypothetical protein H0T46_06935 [Deltaproteobacteria bacterium]|nr:hypothetical protein [Deltaproteobacteria bacterium]